MPDKMASKLPSTFKQELYLEKYEYTTRYVLSCSYAEALTLKELLDIADPESKKMWDELTLNYIAKIGSPILREEIGQIHGVTKDDVLIVVPQEGIYIAMNCLVQYLKTKNNNKPFHAISVYPAFQSLYEFLTNDNCDLDFWATKLTPSGWTFNISDLKEKLKPNTKLLVVNFPHNPTGFLPQIEEWNELIALCREKDIFLFSDEMYSFTNNDGTAQIPSACSMYQNSISLYGMSKSLALPGVRLGWLCTKNAEILSLMSSFKGYITLCAPSPSEVLSIIGLRCREKILQHTMGIVQKNLKALEKFFARHQDVFEWYPPRAGTTAFVKLRGWLLHIGEGGASGFCEALLKEKEVLFLPAKMYDFKDEYVRLGFGRRNLEECLVPLEEFLNQNKPSSEK